MSELEQAQEAFARIRARHGAQDKPVFEENDFFALGLCNGQFGPTFLVNCPACGYFYNHTAPDRPRQLNVRDGGTGNCLSFRGECGHLWTLHFGFHKGQTFATFTLDGYDDPNTRTR
jgi:hypothetical protein